MGKTHQLDALPRAFSRLVSGEDEQIDLARAALVIARTEYPDLDIDACIHRLDELAERTREELAGSVEPHEVIRGLNHVLFDLERFRGNRGNYYDPRNSFLNDVLDRKLGIPITLSLVYMEVARRIGFPLFGIGMPGHFLLKFYDVEVGQILLDPFNRGAVVTASDCQRRLEEIYSGQLEMRSEFLTAITRRQMLTRMLNNLRSIYLSARNIRKTLAIVDLVLAMYPRSPEDVKQRALLRLSIGHSRPALNDFEDYLKMAPDASDADEIRETALSIRRMLANMN